MNRDPLRELLALRDKPRRTIVGLISGNSADGIDAAVIRVAGSGAQSQIDLVAFETVPLDPRLRQRIWSLPDDCADSLCELNFLIGEAFALATGVVLERAGLKTAEVDLIGSHGQTARHRPPGGPGGRHGSTMQIGEGAVIAERTGLPVICDFRVADVAAGGHGAPLIPLVDYLLFRGTGRPIALLNLGGIANVTVVADRLDEVIAFDTGPANMPLDAVARAASGGQQTFDLDGRSARRGQVDGQLLGELLQHPYFALPPPKSTGREAFGRDFTNPLIDRFGDRLDDLMATLAQLTVETIGSSLERHVLPHHAIGELYVSGGGVHNTRLIELLQHRLAPVAVRSLSALGLDPDAKEAVGFAVLANETLFCHAGNVPAATGAAGPRILGKIVLPSATARPSATDRPD